MESTCSNGHSRKWTSQPIHNKLPLGNLFLSGGILFSGSSPSSVLKCLKHSGIATFTERTYRRIQTAYLVPAVENIWKINQEKALETCFGRNVKLSGDGRCCSPGHTAKYGSYSLMDLETGKVLEVQLVQFYDGNSTNDAPYVIPPMRSFASRGNNIAIQCVHDCEDVYIALHRIALRQIFDVEVRSSGLIESPRYSQIDGESPLNLQMIWVLISVRLATFKLTFLKFSLTESPKTCLDTLKIQSTEGFSEVLCGNSATPLEYHMTSNKITVMYIKNSGFPSDGFILRYTACFTKIEKTEGMIIVPSFNVSVRCVYMIEVDRGRIIEMNIAGIDGIEIAGSNCPGRIHIHDGAPPPVEFSTLCSSNDGPIKVESTSNVVYITYTGQSNPDRNTVIARYIYKSAYRKYFRGETGIIFLPEIEVEKTKECQFFISVSKLKKIRLYFHRDHSRIDNDTCSSIMNVTDGDASSIILYSGCVFSKLPEFIETTSNTMTIIVFLNDQLKTSRPLGFYTVYEATTLPIKKIIIASLGLVILFLTGNISVWIWRAKKTKTSGRSTSTQRDIVIDNNTVYDIQEENIDNPYEEVE